MSFGGFGSASSSSAAAAANTNKDVEIQPAPTDTVSALSFSPKANFLAASSWDNQTRIWEIGATGVAIPKAAIQHEAPALCVHWSPDGTKVLSAGCDKAGRVLDVTTGQQMQVAAHDAPIRCCRFVEINGSLMAVTGSWDKTLRYWDLRNSAPAFTFNLSERCYVMDTVQQMMVVGTADRQMYLFNLANPSVPYKQHESQLKWQTRSIALSPNMTKPAYVAGSIEGRCHIQYFTGNPNLDKDSFSFKCHRDQPGKEVHAVNSIVFHPVHGTFATAGSDGGINFWDKDSKQRLKNFTGVGGPITASAFNQEGTIYAYSIGYDWHKGYMGNIAGGKTKIMLHSVNQNDVKPKPAQPKSGFGKR